MGSGVTPRCLAVGGTVPACPPPQEMGLGMASQWETPGPLTHSTLPNLKNLQHSPTSFPCSYSAPDIPPSLTVLWEVIYFLRMPRRAGYQRPVTAPFLGSPPCVLVNIGLSQADLSAQPSGLFPRLLLPRFTPAKCLVPPFPLSHPLRFTPTPTVSCILVLDHPLLWIILLFLFSFLFQTCLPWISSFQDLFSCGWY